MRVCISTGSLSGLYTPGSVFKVVTTAAALEQLPGVEERTFTCDGSVTIGDQVITCPYAHGEMDLSDAFARSCNGCMPSWRWRLGPTFCRTTPGRRGCWRASPSAASPQSPGCSPPGAAARWAGPAWDSMRTW